MDQDAFSDVVHAMFMLDGATDESIGRELRRLHDENVDVDGNWLE